MFANILDGGFPNSGAAPAYTSAVAIGWGLGCVFKITADMLSDGSTSMSSLALLTLALALVALQGVIEDIEQWCRIVQGKC